MPLLLVSSPRFADHVTPPGHPERVERAHVLDAIADRWRARGGQVQEPRRATRDELARVHTDGYLESLETARDRAVMLDPDTFTSPRTLDVAALAAGAVVTGLEWVLGPGGKAPTGAEVPPDAWNDSRHALALVRPPGHHAEAGRAMGFCFFNNVAIGAAAALASGVRRIAIVDIDVHHGNGTQHSFYRDPRVLFVSTHQYPFYPGTGAAGDVGDGDGRGFTVNVPLEGGCTDGDYAVVWERVVVPVVDEFAPELVLVSAGFDAHDRDPIAHMRMSAAGFAVLTSQLVALAERHARGRLLLVTEGGYDLPALGESLDAVVRVLAGETAPGAAGLTRDTGRGATAVKAIQAAQAGRWHAL